MAIGPGLLARGPWTPDQVEVSWRHDTFVPDPSAIEAADLALNALRRRGSPSHDGLAARLAGFDSGEHRLCLELQPARWALGAGGSVEVDENPTHSMDRELREEWSVIPERLTVEAMVCLPSGVVLLVGMAWLPDGAKVSPDHEHDEFAWWPADVEQWPAEADEPLRRMGALLSYT